MAFLAPPTPNRLIISKIRKIKDKYYYLASKI